MGRVPYLVQAAGGAVLAPGGEIAQLHVQQVDQLAQGADGIQHVAAVQRPLGLLRELAGDHGGRLAGA